MAFETETWWYAGRRELKSRLAHAFTPLQDEGFLLYSKAPKSPVIGASYRVEVERSSDHVTAKISSAVLFLADTERHADIDQWRLEDRTAVALVEQYRAVKRMAQANGELGLLTLQDIRVAYSKAPTVQRWGLVAAVLAYIEKGVS